MTGPAFRKSILPAVVLAGISSVTAQIAFAREVINVFSGNEVVLGVVFSLWLLLAGLGAWLGRFVHSLSVARFLFLSSLWGMAFLPVGQILLLRFLKYAWFARGVLPGPADLVLWSALLPLPFGILSGAVLTLASLLLSEEEEGSRSLGRVYVADSMGDVLGGLLFTFVLIPFLSNLHVLYVSALLCLTAFALPGSWGKGGRPAPVPLAAGALLLGLLVFLPLDRTGLSWLYPGQRLLVSMETPYGRVVAADRHGQVSFFENGELLFSVPEVFSSEERVHFALAQVPKVEKVLLLSGGLSGTLGEIEKHGPSLVDYVELDPAILSPELSRFGEPPPANVRVHPGDGRAFVEGAEDRYGAVLMDLPDPASLQINRFYTVEFFREVRRILREDGVFSFSVSGGENFIGRDQGRFLSSLRNALRGVFGHVLAIPGERVVFLAAMRPLSADVGPLLEKKGVSAVYVNDAWLSGRLTEDRVSGLERELRAAEPPNRDFYPAAFQHRIRIWLSMFRERYLAPLLLAVLFSAFYFLRLDLPGKVIFTTGFVAAAMEVVLLLSYQILHGSVYTGIGFLLAAFLSGLALGAFLSGRFRAPTGATLAALDGAVVLFLLFYAFLVRFGPSLLSPAVFALLSVLMGGLAGAEFPVAGRLVFTSPEKTAGSLYAADLLGGSLGAFAAGLLLIPRFGLVEACLLLSVKGLLLFGFLVRKKR
jgi:spermidine synthase